MKEVFMQMERIAVVGCGGMIGEVICKNLCKDFIVKGGQRRQPTALLSLNNFEYHYLDIFDWENLITFCADCTVVINCAGPEFVIKDRVAQAAMNVGAKYIDASNAILLSQEQKQEPEANGVNYIGAGFCPGITGLLLRRVINHLLDETKSVNCYIGGAENYTKTSISDILMSGYSVIGKTDSYWSDRAVKSENINMMQKEFVPEIDVPVYKKPYLSQEIIDILEDSSVEELHWYNIAANDYIFRLAMQFYQMQLESSVEEAMEKLDISLEGKPKEEWVAFVIDATGVKDGKNVRCRLNLQMETSSELTGTVAAETARQAILSNRPNGTYWAHEVLPIDFMNQYSFSNKHDFYEEKLIEI